MQLGLCQDFAWFVAFVQIWVSYCVLVLFLGNNLFLLIMCDNSTMIISLCKTTHGHCHLSWFTVPFCYKHFAEFSYICLNSPLISQMVLFINFYKVELLILQSLNKSRSSIWPQLCFLSFWRLFLTAVIKALTRWCFCLGHSADTISSWRTTLGWRLLSCKRN